MGYMDYVARNSLAKNNQQVLTSFDWDIDITFSATYAAYHPDIMTIKSRLLSVSGLQGVPSGDLLQYKLRGYTMQQPGMTTMEPQDVTFNFQDFEDQSIQVWLLDWRSKMNSWRNRYSYRKEDLLVDVTVYQLNSSRQAVFKWECKSGLLGGQVSTEETGRNEKEALGEIGVPISFEFIDPIPLNI